MIRSRKTNRLRTTLQEECAHYSSNPFSVSFKVEKNSAGLLLISKIGIRDLSDQNVVIEWYDSLLQQLRL